MSFDSRSVSFRRFLVTGKSFTPDDVLAGAERHLLAPRELNLVEEVEYGWSGGAHVLDTELKWEKNVFADCVHIALRIDTNKPPAELKKAYLKQEEAALAKSNPSGFISKLQKREAKDTVQRKLDDERRTGKFHKTRLVPVLIDCERSLVYSPASGPVFEKLGEIFERSFERQLQPLTSGVLAMRRLEGAGRIREYEDLRPTRFAMGPEGESQAPDYPWVVKSGEARDFLGNEFLLWLWHETEVRSGELGPATVMIDRSMTVDCAYGQTGRDTFKADGPARMPEAMDALRSGKVPRAAGIVMDSNRSQFNFTIDPEAMAIGGLKLPDVEEAETPRVLFEERIALLRDFCASVNAMFDLFLDIRVSGQWQSRTLAMRRWIERTNRRENVREPMAAVAS